MVTYTTYGQLLIIPSLSHDASTVNKFSHKFGFTFYCRKEFFPARYSIQFLNFPLFSLPCCKEEFFLAIQASYPNSIIPIQLIILVLETYCRRSLGIERKEKNKKDSLDTEPGRVGYGNVECVGLVIRLFGSNANHPPLFE